MDQEHRQGGRGPDEQGLTGGREHGLDPLVGVAEGDAEAIAEIGVEGGVRVELRVQVRDAGDADVRALQSDALVVGEQHPLQVPDRLAPLDRDLGGELLGAGEAVQADEVAAGPPALAADALGVAGQRERLLQLGPGDDGAAPLRRSRPSRRSSRRAWRTVSRATSCRWASSRSVGRSPPSPNSSSSTAIRALTA